MIKVIVADDHPVIRAGVSAQLQREQDIEVIAQCENSTDLFTALEANACDVLVTDYWMPHGTHGDGLDMVLQLKQRWPQLSIVLLSMLDNMALIRDLMRAGVEAIVSKKDNMQSIAKAIHQAHMGRPFDSTSIRDQGHTLAAQTDKPLSPREIEVLRRVAQGQSILEIAQSCGRSTKTISTQKVQAMHKLGLKNSQEIFRYAVTHGLING